MVHRGWGGASNFLEKIIEYPRYLPPPTDHDLDYFIEKSVAALGDALNAAILRGLAPVLPRNPRKLKLYLRLLASLHGLLARFDPAELDGTVFHLAQLMRSEFPEETRHMIDDHKVIEDLRMGHIRDLMRRDRPAGEQQATTVSPVIGYAPRDAQSAARFWQLYNALRNRELLLKGRYSVRQLFTLPDEPPAITWKELETFVAGLSGDRCRHLRTWLSNAAGAVHAARLEAAFYLVIEMRQGVLSQAADAKLDDDRKRLCSEAGLLTNILECLVVDLGAFSSGALPIDAWKALLQHVQRWSNFTKLDEYLQLRTAEHALLKESITVMTPDLRAAALELFDIHDTSAGEIEDHFTTLIRELRTDLAKHAAETLLAAFASPDSLDALLAGNRNVTMRRILLLPSSPLYRDNDYRKAFLDLAERAMSDPVIQSNFVEFVERLFYEAVEGGSLGRDELRKLFRDVDVIEAVWRAALATPLNARTAGGLRLRRRRLVDDGVLTETDANSLLPLPEWWAVLEDTFLED